VQNSTAPRPKTQISIFEHSMLRRIFECKRQQVKLDTEACITRSFTIYTLDQLIYGGRIEEDGNGEAYSKHGRDGMHTAYCDEMPERRNRGVTS
jgi:hypothetical protein